jgi:hypothetical protein
MAKRIDRDNEPYRPILSVSKEKTEELFSLINMMDTQQIKQFSMINSITLNVESSVTGDNLMHKVITLNNGLKKEFHRLNMIKFLYQNGVNPDKPNRENQTPLHLACKEQYFSIVEFLVSIGVDLNFKDNIGFTPFHYALMGKIELYNEPKEIKDFIEKPKKIDFDKKDNLIKVKQDIWNKIKDSPFISAISNTVDTSLYSDENIRKDVLGFIKKISENILKINKADSIKLIREQVNMLKKNIENSVKEKWGEFRDISELQIHDKESDSFLLPGNDLSPLKNINVKDEIKASSKKAKDDIKDNCKKIQDEADKDVDINQKLNDIYVKFYKEFVDKNDDLFDNFNIAGSVPPTIQKIMKPANNISSTNWNDFNEERMHELAIDFADNIINWDDMTFIGGSREITIIYDLEIIKTILRYDTIEERVLHILGQLDNIPMDNFDVNNISTATVTSVLGVVQNIISNDLEIITRKLPYDLIFRNDTNTYPPLAPIYQEQLSKWKSLFDKKELASVIYAQICWNNCLKDIRTDNLTGVIGSEACALALAIKISNGVLTNEFLEAAFKKYHISFIAQSAATTYNKFCGMINVLLTNKLDSDPNTYLDDSITKQYIKDTVQELIQARTDNAAAIDEDKPKIDFTTKKNELIKIIMDEVNLMKVKPIESDILQLITFISNSFQGTDATFFDLNEMVFTNIFPAIPDEDKYSDETINNYINKIIHIIKERQSTMLIPYIYHLLEIFNLRRGGGGSYETHSLKKLNEARHLGLYYKGLIPYLTSIDDIIIEKHAAPGLQPKTRLGLKPNNWNFNPVTHKLENQDIPLIGNYIGDMAPAVPVALTYEQKLNYYSFILAKCRPPLKESIKVLSERNKHNLINILSKLTSNKDSENSLINLIESNSKLAKLFTNIYPIMMVLGELIEFEEDKKIDKLISNIITNINKYNSYILLYYYLMNKEKLIKIPKFNYYEIPQIGKTGRFLYFDDDIDDLNLNRFGTPNVADTTPESSIPTLNTGTIYNKGIPLFRRLMRNLSNNIYKDNYLIKKESLVRSKSLGLPPSIASILPEFHKYNLVLLLKDQFEYYLTNPTDAIFTNVESIKNELDVTNNDVLTYFTIGKIIEELISEHCKDYIQKQASRIVTKLLKKIDVDKQNPLLTDISMIVKSDDFSLNLNKTNLTSAIIFIDPIDAFNLYQFSKEEELKDDNCIFIIYPDEYANSELLTSKYKLTLNKDIYKKLLDNNINPYILDLNNQSAVFPILKIHNYNIIKELKTFIDYREYSDINALDFLIDEYNNHSSLLTNKEKNFKKWLSNFVIYQKNEVKTLILSNDKFGNNVPNYLEDSFEVVFYLANQYLSESINKMPTDLQTKIKTELNYTIDFKKYLFINENLFDVFELQEDNFLQDLIDVKRTEISKIKKKYEKLNDGATKNALKAKESEINAEIIQYQTLMNFTPITKRTLDNTKILARYNDLNYIAGTMTKALSKLIKSNNLNESFDLLTFKFYSSESEKINNIKSSKTIDSLYTDFYEHTNNLSEIYFTSGNYFEKNKVLQFSVELLVFMTRYFIIFPYIIILKKTLYSYFQSIYPNFSFTEINDRINYCFNYDYVYGNKLNRLEQHLYQIVADKLVYNSVRKFKNIQEELEFVSENISEILDNIINLFTINPIMPIPANSKFFVNMKEINAYFDTFTAKTILNWLVVIENTFKFNINQGRIVRCIINLTQ